MGDDEKELTNLSELLVAGPQLRLLRRVRPTALEDRVSPFDPSLGGGLAEVDLLALVAAGEGVQVDSLGPGSSVTRRAYGIEPTGRCKYALLQLGLGLLLGRALDMGHTRVGTAVENKLAVDGALAERRPAFGVVVIHVLWVGRRRSDVVLQHAEVGEDLGDACLSVVVD